jgi:Sulfatase
MRFFMSAVEAPSTRVRPRPRLEPPVRVEENGDRPSPKARSPRALLPARIRTAHLLALSAFGIAEPAFEVLKKNPDYLVEQGFTASEVVLYGVLLLVVPTVVLMAVELAVGLLSRRAAALVHQLAVGLLAFLLVGRASHQLFHPLVTIAVSLVAAVLCVWVYGRWEPARLLLTFSSFASVVFLALFLTGTPLAKLSTTDARGVPVAHVSARTPVVLVIFDEFALSSLTNEQGRIDAARYPNFAALSRSATWYRDATTVHDYTSWAVPAILTGRISGTKELPLVADHPENLFTLLGPSYRIHAVQSVTRLCPARLCPKAHESLGTRVRKLSSYVGTTIYAGHPLTSGPWSNPPRLVSRFISELRPGDRQLYVLHVLLPHSPWRYLPSGKTYKSPPPGSGPVHDTWGKSDGLVDHGYKRHLLQVEFVDRELGLIVRRLRATGLWNRSLFVVVADHGVSFLAGGHERAVDLHNIGDIAPVPLFVKTPGQRVGRIDDRSAKTIDVVPTIADVLHIRMPWKLDGRSLLSPNRPRPSEIVIHTSTGTIVQAPWSYVRAEFDKTVVRKTRLFGS